MKKKEEIQHSKQRQKIYKPNFVYRIAMFDFLSRIHLRPRNIRNTGNLGKPNNETKITNQDIFTSTLLSA